MDEDNPAEAVDQRKQVLDTLTRTLGPEHPATQACMSKLAEALYMQKRFEPAKALNTQLLQIRKRTLGDDDLLTIETTMMQAMCLGVSGEIEQMRELLGECKRRLSRTVGCNHPMYIQATKCLDDLDSPEFRQGNMVKDMSHQLFLAQVLHLMEQEKFEEGIPMTEHQKFLERVYDLMLKEKFEDGLNVTVDYYQLQIKGNFDSDHRYYKETELVLNALRRYEGKRLQSHRKTIRTSEAAFAVVAAGSALNRPYRPGRALRPGLAWTAWTAWYYRLPD
jgi:hypothetical protein